MDLNISEEDKKQFISGLMMAIAVGIAIGTLARIVFAPAQHSQPFNFECMKYCEGNSYMAYCIQECNKDNGSTERFIKKKPTPSIIGNDSIINYSFQ